MLEQQGILNSAEAQSIIEVMEDETSSIFCIADNRSITSRQSKVSEFSATLDIPFRFDAEVLSSRIYAVAYRSHLRQVIASEKHGDTAPATAARESPGAKRSHTDIDLLFLNRRANSQTKKLALDTPRERQQECLEKLPSAAGIRVTTCVDMNSKNLNGTAENPQSQEEPEKPYLKQDKMPISMTSWHKRAQISPPLYSKPEKNTGGRPWLPLLNGLPHRTRQVHASKVKHLEIEKHAEPIHSPQVKVLLLGTSDSGKSTLLKAIKLFQDNPWTAEERDSFSESIFSNVCDGTRTVLDAMEYLDIQLDSSESLGHVQTILMQSNNLGSIAPEVHSAIAALARDRGFQHALKQGKEHNARDNLVL